MSVQEHPEGEEHCIGRGALTSRQRVLLKGAHPCRNPSPPSRFDAHLVSASAAGATVADFDVAREDSTHFCSTDDCDTPRYIPCKARYALGSTAVLVELLHDMDD
ncbi:hypothetical protein JKF63_07670 [Porcisia hertigi]|uniref:Uncharacterized protein n=1 Tax=Porcisia hertigi TaxID=2761500 RepID=A0A836IXN5_9TRYP|nr:hypothetical protein JKF63_07670 [Porcisia hertigi]